MGFDCIYFRSMLIFTFSFNNQRNDKVELTQYRNIVCNNFIKYIKYSNGTKFIC